MSCSRACHFAETLRDALVRQNSAHGLEEAVSCCMPPADFDVAAVHFVEGLIEELQKQGLQLALANPSHQVRGVAEEGSWGCSN